MLHSTTWHDPRAQRYASDQAREAHELLWSLLAVGHPLRQPELRTLQMSAKNAAKSQPRRFL